MVKHLAYKHILSITARADAYLQFPKHNFSLNAISAEKQGSLFSMLCLSTAGQQSWQHYSNRIRKRHGWKKQKTARIPLNEYAVKIINGTRYKVHSIYIGDMDFRHLYENLVLLFTDNVMNLRGKRYDRRLKMQNCG